MPVASREHLAYKTAMRLMLLLLAALAFVAPARAQIFQVTVDGTLMGGAGIYSDVTEGTPFVFSATFNAANAALISSTATSATYADPAGVSSFSFDGVTVSGIAPQIQITSNDNVGGTLLYGFEFSQYLTVGGYAVQLLGVNSSDAPSTSLASLHASPISDFNNSLNLAAYDGATGSVGGGKSTSFSVTVESAPEPKSIALAAFAVLTFCWLRQRQLRRCGV